MEEYRSHQRTAVLSFGNVCCHITINSYTPTTLKPHRTILISTKILFLELYTSRHVDDVGTNYVVRKLEVIMCGAGRAAVMYIATTATLI